MQTLLGPQPGRESPAESESHDKLAEARREMTYRCIAYVHAFRMHLRDQWQPEELAELLPAEELEALASEHNRPIAMLLRMGERTRALWAAGWVNAYHMGQIEQTLGKLTDIQGACERIKSTPIPFSYTVLIHRLVGFYCFALPFGIVDTVRLMTPVVVALISFAFFGLDAIGDEIEQPFGVEDNDLPLSALSRMIEVNLRQTLREPHESLPPLLTPDEHGYLS